MIIVGYTGAPAFYRTPCWLSFWRLSELQNSPDTRPPPSTSVAGYDGFPSTKNPTLVRLGCCPTTLDPRHHTRHPGHLDGPHRPPLPRHIQQGQVVAIHVREARLGLVRCSEGVVGPQPNGHGAQHGGDGQGLVASDTGGAQWSNRGTRGA